MRRSIFALSFGFAGAACSAAPDAQPNDTGATALDSTVGLTPPTDPCHEDQQCNPNGTSFVCVDEVCRVPRRFSPAPRPSIELGPEVLVDTGWVVDVEWDGTGFLVVSTDQGSTRARRLDANGSPGREGWPMPEGLTGLAFDGSKYMALRNVPYPGTGSNMVETAIMSTTGTFGEWRSVDLYCRNSGTLCYGQQIVYGGGAFLVVYADAGWRDLSYALFNADGSIRQRQRVTSWFYQGTGAALASATFDGSKFWLAWQDFRDLTNAASIYATSLNPAGGNRELSGQAVFRNPGDDIYAAGKPTITAGGLGLLVTFDGFRDSKQVRIVNPSTLAPEPFKVTGVGEQFDLNTRPSLFDGLDFAVLGRWCPPTQRYCFRPSGVYVTRVGTDGARLDRTPLLLSADGKYPMMATNRRGRQLVAYTRGGSVYARTFTTYK